VRAPVSWTWSRAWPTSCSADHVASGLLLTDLSYVVLGAGQIEAYLRQAFEHLWEVVPPGLVERVEADLPTLTTPSGADGG
jgi:hypothetical protein